MNAEYRGNLRRILPGKYIINDWNSKELHAIVVNQVFEEIKDIQPRHKRAKAFLKQIEYDIPENTFERFSNKLHLLKLYYKYTPIYMEGITTLELFDLTLKEYERRCPSKGYDTYLTMLIELIESFYNEVVRRRYKYVGKRKSIFTTMLKRCRKYEKYSILEKIFNINFIM
jgi:hypothetical protein